MARALRTILFLVLFLAAPLSPALARMVVGVTPAVMPGANDRAALAAFEGELSARLGEPVQVRSFDSEAILIDWLVRFRELDAALISRSQLRSLPAGALIPLAEFPAAAAVTHPGEPAARQEALGRGFRALAADDRGQQLLGRLAGTGKTAPPRKPAPVAAAAAPRPVAVAAKAPAPPAQVAPPRPAMATPPTPPPAPAQPPAAAKPPQPLPAPAPSAPPAKPVIAPAPAKAPATSPAQAEKPQPAPSPAAAETSGSKRSRLLLIAALVVLAGIGVKLVLLMRSWEQRRKAPAAPAQPPAVETFDYQSINGQTQDVAPAAATAAIPPPATARVPAPAATGTQPVALRVNVGAREKVSFDFRTPTPGVTRPEPTITPVAVAVPSPAAEPAAKKQLPPRRKPVAGGDDELFPPGTEDLVVEQGRLGKIKIPALLKRCADLPRPVILRVRTRENETCVHFAGGQICHAYSRNWRSPEQLGQWRKLGYLMVREGTISESQRDQALELVGRQEGLRLASALMQLGVIDLEALRHILARQARTTLFALILFSAGEYRIEADDGTIPAEESIALQVDELIREASHHQAEWTAIRKVLPTLDTRLDFAPDGREKLDQVRLSVQQQLLLSQVDGQTAIGTLCNGSTMMDYEVCRFLYLMVKAGVLQLS